MQLLPTQQSETTSTLRTATGVGGSGMHQLAPLPLPSYVGKRLLDIKPSAGQELNGTELKGGRGGGGDGRHANVGDDDEPQQIQIEIPLAH
ncbi:unnamed protein product [Ceratitis capitata]|uniref:(Mediterranean fruit fly) hypothetical protein n=1 Tax=Ceratitis capitata TaxID=7213 RepID=A0A811UB57_CERCA|nr:unnamed protein product [Ceratitis capitata]